MALASWFGKARRGRPKHALGRRSLHVERLEDRALLAAGDLDPTFGGDGKVTDAEGSGQDVVVQSDGKIVTVGTSVVGGSLDFAVVRYNSDGSLDSSFGSGGMVTTDFAGGQEDAFGVALQADGKIVVAGQSVRFGAREDFALARYNADGSLDTTFGSGGKVTTDFASSFDSAHGLALQADSKIVVVGRTRQAGAGPEFALARYNADGSLDTSFGAGGKVTTAFLFNDGALDIALQADGKIVAAGSAEGSSFDFAVARYNADGSLDTSFGSGGKVTTDFGKQDSVGSMALQHDGKIMLAGSSGDFGARDFALARYNPNGSLDATFGSGGKVTTEFGIGDDAAGGVAVQADGRIVAAGYSSLELQNPFRLVADFALARYNANGSLDSRFGSDGMVTTDFGAIDLASGVALQADGKIVAAGGSSGAFAVARYLADPDPEEELELVRDELQDIIDDHPGTPLADKVEDALASVVAALAELSEPAPDLPAVLGTLAGAVGDLEAAVSDGLLDAAQGARLMDQIAAVARHFAARAIDEAHARLGDPAKIEDAQEALDLADLLRASGDFKDAIDKFKDALAIAQCA